MVNLAGNNDQHPPGTPSTNNYNNNRHHHPTFDGGGRGAIIMRRHHPRPSVFSVVGAIDEPPPVASVMDGIWTPRRTIHRTPRRLATLVNPSASSAAAADSGEGGEEEDTSGTKVCIAGDQFIVVASSLHTPLCVYQIPSSSSVSAHEEKENENDAPIKPWSTVPLIENDNDNDHDNNDTAVGSNNTNTNNHNKQSTVVSLTALPFGQSLIYGEPCRKEEGHVVAFFDDGQGFIIRIRKDKHSHSHSHNHNNEGNKDAHPVAAVGGEAGAIKLYEFSTMNFGVTCASVIPTSHDSPDCQLLVGYQSGYLENWKIFRFSTEKTMAKLLWRGMYPHHYSIQSVAPLNVNNVNTESTTDTSSSNVTVGDHNKDTTTTTATAAAKNNKTEQEVQKPKRPKREKPLIETKETNENKGDTPRYLLVTLLSPTQRLRTDAMVEVIDVGGMPTAWRSSSSTSGVEQTLGHLRAVSLDKRWILPHAGMEILNSATIGTSDDPALPKRTHFIPSQATGSICSLTNGNAVALADGTIALVSAKDQKGELQWGIANDYNQLLLSYPSIGCAPLLWGTAKQWYRPHVACCLRGGTVYLAPVVPAEDQQQIGDATPLTVFSLDTETDTKYVQSFTAGDLILSSDPPPNNNNNNNEESAAAGGHQQHHNQRDSHETEHVPPSKIPVLIYGWAGGIVDVYCCELMETRKSCRAMISHREISALEELIANGSAQMLRDLLPVIPESDPLLQQPMWVEAQNEYQREEFADDLTVDLLLQQKCSALRTLLLLMSTNKIGFPESK